MAQDPNYCGCGDSKWWALPETHWAHGCCAIHDKTYTLRRQGRLASKITRKQTDAAFYGCMKQVVARRGGKKKEELEAWLLYQIVKLAGGFYWRKDNEAPER